MKQASRIYNAAQQPAPCLRNMLATNKSKDPDSAGRNMTGEVKSWPVQLKDMQLPAGGAAAAAAAARHGSRRSVLHKTQLYSRRGRSIAAGRAGQCCSECAQVSCFE